MPAVELEGGAAGLPPLAFGRWERGRVEALRRAARFGALTSVQLFCSKGSTSPLHYDQASAPRHLPRHTHDTPLGHSLGPHALGPTPSAARAMAGLL